MGGTIEDETRACEAARGPGSRCRYDTRNSHSWDDDVGTVAGAVCMIADTPQQFEIQRDNKFSKHRRYYMLSIICNGLVSHLVALPIK